MEFRFYWIASDDHIKEAENIECASDAEAKRRALEIRGEYPTIEVWDGVRRVERVTAPASEQRERAA